MGKVTGWKYKTVIQAAELCAQFAKPAVSIEENKGENMEGKEQYFTISQLNEMLNITGPTLRFWECEFAGILTPLRTPGGQRRYTDAHIKVLERIISLKEKGLKLAEIKAEMARENHVMPGKEFSDNIDILTERITKAVRKEIQQFFHNSSDQITINDTEKYCPLIR